MDNNLRMDITVDKESMTKEEAESYDEFIEVMARLFSRLMAIDDGQQSEESVG